jgi:pimeloyl-ACP methyl ester carboxylesterase
MSPTEESGADLVSDIAIDSAEPAVLTLHGNPEWPQPVLEEHQHRVVSFDAGADLAGRVQAAAAAVEEFGSPMHVVASGADGAVAVRLAITRPDLVKSLVLADCSAATDLGDVTGELPDVPVPTLVVAACPDGVSGLEESQTLAGQIPNGVFVVMDHVDLPVFGSRPGSFSAWSSSFIDIVEGLRSLDGEAVPTVPDTTPHHAQPHHAQPTAPARET